MLARHRNGAALAASREPLSNVSTVQCDASLTLYLQRLLVFVLLQGVLRLAFAGLYAFFSHRQRSIHLRTIDGDNNDGSIGDNDNETNENERSLANMTIVITRDGSADTPPRRKASHSPRVACNKGRRRYTLARLHCCDAIRWSSWCRSWSSTGRCALKPPANK